MTKQKQEQMMLMVLAIALLMAVGYYAVIQPSMVKYTAANLKLVGNRNMKETMEKSIKLMKSNKVKCDKDMAIVTNEQAKFVGKGSYYELMEVVNACAAEADMKIEQSELRTDKTTAPTVYYSESWIRITTRSTYHSLGKWLSNVLQTSPYVRVVELSENSDPVDNGMHSITLTVSFLVSKGAL